MLALDTLILARQVCDIAYLAGQAILKIYDTAIDFGVEQKNDHSPLTIADKAANDIICEHLLQLSPKLPIVSEENKSVPYEQRQGYSAFWLVDPLDGTKEFIKRNGEFTVNIALIEQCRSTLGVVYIPVTDELYYSAKDKGAYKIANGEAQRLIAPPFQLDDEGLRIVCSRSHLNEATEAFVNQLSNPELIARGSSLKFLALAKGDAHIYPRLAPTMEWDTAAAQIILEEAGGKVIDQSNDQPLRYNKEILRNPYFVAYGAVQ